jgi:hypothetical protein
MNLADPFESKFHSGALLNSTPVDEDGVPMLGRTHTLSVTQLKKTTSMDIIPTAASSDEMVITTPISPLEQPAELLVTNSTKIKCSNYPEELLAGLNELARYSPHGNLSTNESMQDDSKGDDETLKLLLKVSFVKNESIIERSLTVSSALEPSWETTGRYIYDIQVNYRRKCEGLFPYSNDFSYPKK